jgi:hypothetical protein
MTLADLEAGLHRPVQPLSTMSEVLDALERVRGSHGGGVKRD